MSSGKSLRRFWRGARAGKSPIKAFKSGSKASESLICASSLGPALPRAAQARLARALGEQERADGDGPLPAPPRIIATSRCELSVLRSQGALDLDLERCFEPLFSTKAPGAGTGLGLTICRDILTAAARRAVQFDFAIVTVPSVEKEQEGKRSQEAIAL